jgi:biotin transporter BioY
MQNLFYVLSFVPITVLVGGLYYRLPRAPGAQEVFMIIVTSCVMSFALTGWGIGLAWLKRKQRRSPNTVIASTIIGSLPLLLYGGWLLVQLL